MATVQMIFGDELADLGVDPKVSGRVSELGDGYERFGDVGLNPVRETMKVAWISYQETEANQVIAFCKANVMRNRIEWTPPNESSPRYFIMTKYSWDYDTRMTIVVKANLREFFGAG